MSPEDSADALEKIRERLYSPTANTSFHEPSLSPRVAPDESQHWQPPPPQPQPKSHKKRLSWTVWFLIGATLFFLIAIGLSSLYLLRGTNTVSSNNIDISVQGPTSIASGSTVPLVLSIVNHNSADIINANIEMDFPDGTRSSDDVTQPLVRYTYDLGTLVAGGTATSTTQAVLFGSVNQSISIPVTLTYQTPNSNATYTKTQNYSVTITSSPITITATSVSSVASGQPFMIAVAVRSNATTPLTNVAVAAVYPTSGFTTTNSGNATSTPGPFYEIGTLEPGEEKDFTIGGVLSGTDANQQSFQFTVGTASSEGTTQISVPYASATTNVTITQPFLATTLTLNNDATDQTIATAGQPVAGLVSWSNTLSSQIQSGQVTIQLKGEALDPNSVQVTNGYFDSSNDTIIFNGQSDPSLQTLNPGDSGSATFSFASKTGAALAQIQNPTIQLSVSVAGESGSSGSQSISDNLTRNVLVATDLGLSSSIVHTTGPFPNSGPWPPIANQTTTYTVELSITNTLNDVAGGEVTTILPQYVNFTGNMTPNDGSLSYDAASRTVTWKVGSIPAGTGISGTPPLTAAFQISLTPSLSQVDSSPILVGNQELTGQDRFTGAQVESTANALTTETTTDPGYQPSFGKVRN